MKKESMSVQLNRILGEWDLLPDSIPLFLTLLNQFLPVTTAYLGSIHNISQRQILYCVHRDLYRLSEELGFQLICKSRFGIFLDGDSAIKRRAYLHLQEQPYLTIFEKPFERQKRLLAILLKGQRGQTMPSLLKFFNFSEITLLNDIKQIKLLAKEHKVHISWSKRHGYHPSGSEIDIRELYLLSVLNAFPTFFLVKLCQQSYSTSTEQESRINSDPWQQLISPNIRKHWETLTRCSRKYNLGFSDRALVEMTLTLDILQDALENKHNIGSLSEQLPDGGDAESFINVIEEISFSMKLPKIENWYQNETTWLNNKLIQLVTRDTPLDFSQAKLEGDAYEQSCAMASDIAIYAAKHLHPQMQIDETLTKGLTNSINNFFQHRIRASVVNRQQYSEIRNLYPYIYRISTSCTEILVNKFEVAIPEDLKIEISKHLIAALDRVSTSKSVVKDVVLICNDETDATLMEARLQKEYPQLLICKTIRREEIDRTDQNLLTADLIISNVKLPVFESKSVVVSPLVTEIDKRLINKFLLPVMREQFEHNQNFEGLPSLEDILTPDNIQIINSVPSWQKAVIEATESLIKKNLIEENYRDAIIEGIEKHGSYMVLWPHVALLHAKPSDGAKKLAVSITIINQGIIFGSSQNDPVQVCVVISTVDNVSHLRILQELNHLFGGHTKLIADFITPPVRAIMTRIKESCRNYYLHDER